MGNSGSRREFVRMIGRKRIFRNHETLDEDAHVQGLFIGIHGEPRKSEPHSQILQFPPRDCTDVFIL